MKGMPLPFEFERKGVDLELVFDKNNFRANSSLWGYNNLNGNCVLNSCSEPTSVLDIARSPSRAISSSTLSSSLGSGGGGSRGDIAGGGAASTEKAGVAAVSGNNEENPSLKWQQDSGISNMGVVSQSLTVPPSLEIGTAAGAGSAAGKRTMDEWGSLLSESAVESPSHEHSILRWIMGDVDDPEMGSLNKVLQFGTAPPPPTVEFEFNGGFGVVEQAFGTDPVGQFGSNFMHNSSSPRNRSNNEKIGLFSNSSSNHSNNSRFPNPQNNMFSSISNNLGTITTTLDSTETKAPIFTPHMLINQHQTQHPENPSFFLPISYANEHEQNTFMPPQAKRHNPGAVGEGPEPVSQITKAQISVPRKELLMGRQVQHQQPMPYQLQLLLQQRPPGPTGPGPKPKMGGDDLAYCHQQQQQQQAIIDQLYKATELVQMGNSTLALEILARLNHQLSPIGNPFHRAAFYCKEALQLTIHSNNNNKIPSTATASLFSLIFKIDAYKSFSEISPFVQFANFTGNQALLEVVEGFDRIHVVDFDIGYGGQWASLMQELALRSEVAPSLKITAFTSPSTHDQLELSLTRENLIHFADEINVVLEFEVMSIDTLNSGSWSLPVQVSENEAIAVNLPVGSLASYQLLVPLVLRFVKHLSPKIVVSVDRGCDRIDLPFPNHIIHALQSYSNLLESLDAANLNMDALQKIERFLLQPGIEKIVKGRFRAPEKTQHWRTLFLSSGFSPVTFSNFTESQAECVVKRSPIRGFNVEKRQSSLVLCWQQKELISASAWRC